MIARYNRTSLIWGGVGLAVQCIGIGLATYGEEPPTDPTLIAIGFGVAIVGTALLVVGMCYYAKAKARHPAWGVVGILSILGLVLLAALPDRSVTHTARLCQQCGYNLHGLPADRDCPECGAVRRVS